MGYTHSWYRPREIDPQTMDTIKFEFEKVSSTFSEANRIHFSLGFTSEPSDVAFTGVYGTAEPMVFCRVSDAEEIKEDSVHENWMETGTVDLHLLDRALQHYNNITSRRLSCFLK